MHLQRNYQLSRLPPAITMTLYRYCIKGVVVMVCNFPTSKTMEELHYPFQQLQKLLISYCEGMALISQYGGEWRQCGRFIYLSVWRRMALMWQIHFSPSMEEMVPMWTIHLPLCMEEDGTDVEDSFFSQYGGDGANVDDSFTSLYGGGWH